MKSNDTSDRLSQWLRWGVFAPNRPRQLRDSLESTFEPALKRDLNTEKNAIAAFATRLNSPDISATLSPLERNSLLAKARSIYENGVVGTTG